MMGYGFLRIQNISSIGGFFNNGGFESESRNQID